MRYLASCSYIGTEYNGWQKQPNAIGIQQIIEDKLSQILSQEIIIYGSSRTDRGVHAEMQTFHFDCESEIHTADVLYKLNRILPENVALNSIKEVSKNFHARFNAKHREYNYKITTKKEPFITQNHTLLYKRLNLSKMNEASSFLIKKLDCKIFSKEGVDVLHHLCDIQAAQWEKKGSTILFTIRANRFLRGMVRIIVGYMIKIGEGKMLPEDFHDITQRRIPIPQPPLAPAVGLTLAKVEYEDVI